MLPYILFFAPKISHIQTLKKTIIIKEKQLSQMQQQRSEYLSNQTNRVPAESTLSLAEKIEEISVNLNMFENLQAINEQQSSADEIDLSIAFQSISYSQLLNFLEKTDNLPRMITIVDLEITSDQYIKNALNVNINLKEKIINL